VKNFLKPDRLSTRLSHKDPKVRIESLQSIDGAEPELQLMIEKLASSDDDTSVRIAAIAKVDNMSLLTGLQLRDDAAQNDSLLGRALHDRMGELLTGNQVTDGDADLLLQKDSSRYAPLFATYSAKESLRTQSLALIEDEDTVVSVLENTRLHDVRMACAKKLVSEDRIKTALNACKARDKVVAKFLQSELDERAAAAAAKVADEEAVDSTLHSMKALADAVWSPQHAGKQTALSDRWKTLSPTLREPHESAFDIASNKVAEKIAEQDKRQAEQATQTSTANDTQSAGGVAASAGSSAVVSADVSNVSDAQEPDVNTLDMLARIKPVAVTDLDKHIPELSAEPGSVSEKLLAHVQSASVLFNPPFDVAKGRPGAVGERIKRVESLLETEKLLPGIPVSDCQYITGLKEHVAELSSRLDKAKQESSDRSKATHRQFAALNATVTDGKWGPASSMFRRLQKKIDAMEPAEKSQFTDKLTRAEKQLDEMADWQDFAARPKLEALCIEMESLPAKELKVQALAKQIKSFQAQWKSLGTSRASNELWPRFKTAGDTAYEPCKAFFEEKQQERQVKLDAKATLCDELEKQFSSYEWDNPDWKAVQRIVNNAKRDWSRNRVQDRKPDRALEQRFSDALKPFDEKLGEQYEANVGLKRELIEKIQKLAEGEINQHSANQAKRLQTSWKQVGPVRRKDDQVLWEEFNGHCKTIYGHQRDARREKYQASMSHVFRAKEIIKELRGIAKGQNSDEQAIAALQTEFQALEEFPDKEKKFLLRDFRGALDACSKVQANASKKRAEAESNEVLRLVELCEQLEACVESPELGTDSLKEDVTHAWDNNQANVSREIQSRLEARRDAALIHLEKSSQFDYSANEVLRRQLLIRMEILADKETPAEDKALRMQYQLEHLRDGMTSGAVVDKRAALAELETEWHAAAPVKQSLKDSLHSRYLAATRR